MIPREVCYRKAPNNKKCALCGYRCPESLLSVPSKPGEMKCILFGENVKEENTCDNFRFSDF